MCDINKVVYLFTYNALVSHESAPFMSSKEIAKTENAKEERFHYLIDKPAQK